MSLFEDTPKGTPTPSVDNLLDEIKNDTGQRKYASTEEALKALKHSQEYIPTLKQQLDAAEARAAEAERIASEAKKLEDIVNGLTAPKPKEEPNGSPAQESSLSVEAVKELVKSQLENSDQEKLMAANEQTVKATLSTMYGDKAADVVKQKAVELGTTAAKLGELAKQSPELVLALFKVPASGTQNPKGSVVIPPINKPNQELPKPAKSVLVGASNKEQTDHFNDLKKVVMERHGITN